MLCTEFVWGVKEIGHNLYKENEVLVWSVKEVGLSLYKENVRRAL